MSCVQLLYFSAASDAYDGFLRALAVAMATHMPRIPLKKKPTSPTLGSVVFLVLCYFTSHIRSTSMPQYCVQMTFTCNIVISVTVVSGSLVSMYVNIEWFRSKKYFCHMMRDRTYVHTSWKSIGWHKKAKEMCGDDIKDWTSNLLRICRSAWQ